MKILSVFSNFQLSSAAVSDERQERNFQRGQMIIETILLAIVLLGITLFVADFFKREELIKKMISGPWQNLSGMIQNGVWAPSSQGMRSHPNSHNRHISLKGDDAK